MIDTLRAVQTPEGIELHLPLAGLMPRASAWLIDALIRAGVYTGLYFVFLILGIFFGEGVIGLGLITMFIIEWFYPVLFEVLRKGQTPGKRTYNLKVIHDDGTPVGWGASMIRNLLRVADFFPLLYGFGVISMMLNRDFKRLGDLAAGTVVVYQDSPPTDPDLPDIRASRPTCPLKLEEQQAVIAFAERRHTLTTERAEELAAMAGPLTEDSAKPAQTLMGMAKWLSGDRPRES